MGKGVTFQAEGTARTKFPGSRAKSTEGTGSGLVRRECRERPDCREREEDGDPATRGFYPKATGIRRRMIRSVC